MKYQEEKSRIEKTLISSGYRFMGYLWENKKRNCNIYIRKDRIEIISKVGSFSFLLEDYNYCQGNTIYFENGYVILYQ